MKIKRLFDTIFDFIKSIYINFKCLPFKQALKMPIKIKWNVHIGKLEKNCIVIKNNDIKKSMIELGYKGAKFIPENKSYFTIKNNGKMIFNGNTTIGDGFNILIDGGLLEFGENVYINRNIQIQCENKVSFGINNLVGWNVKIRDTDGHHIYENSIKKDKDGVIKFGNHIWIASDVTILKNTEIKDNSVIACESLICGKKFEENNVLIAGSPAKIIKRNIDWEE